MPMHMHGQELQQIDGRYTDTQETEIDRKLSMYYAYAYVTSSASSDSSARSNAAKKMEPSEASELVELVNYNDLWMRCVNG